MGDPARLRVLPEDRHAIDGRDRARDHSLGDDLHFVAKVGWDSRYTRKDGEEVRIDFVNTYFVRVEDEEPRIFGYVTGDERRRCSKNTA
jgi:hypothetical protein